MIKINKIEGKNIYEFKIAGAIDEHGINDFYALLETKLDDNEDLKLLGEIKEFPVFEDFEAFTETLKVKLKAIRGVVRYAVVSDKSWVKKVLPIGNFVSPGIPMKFFDVNEKAQAIEWLENDEEKSLDSSEYFSNMDIEKIAGSNIYSFVIDGRIDEAGIIELHKIISHQTVDEKINILAEYRDFNGFENVNTLIETIQIDFSAFNKIEKYAVLSDKKWVEQIIKIEDFILPNIQIKLFDLSEKEAAISWLKPT